MNPFLACFLASALVQAIFLFGGIQYMAWRTRKDAAEGERQTAEIMAKHDRIMEECRADRLREAFPPTISDLLTCPMCGRANNDVTPNVAEPVA